MEAIRARTSHIFYEDRYAPSMTVSGEKWSKRSSQSLAVEANAEVILIRPLPCVMGEWVESRVLVRGVAEFASMHLTS